MDSHTSQNFGNPPEPALKQSCEVLEKSANNGVQLKREIGLFSAASLITGVMIGSGIFISPASALIRSGSVGLCLIVWAVSGLISLLGALAFVELGTVVPKSGAQYSYFLEAYGKLHSYWGPLPSFTYALTNILIVRPQQVAVICLTFAEYVCQPFTYAFDQLSEEDMDMVKKSIAVGALVLITAINIISVKLYVVLQNFFTICKLIACAVVIFGGLYILCAGKTDHFSNPFEGTTTSVKDIALAFYSGLWAYDGWNTINFVTEEVKNPEKNILRSIIIALPLVTGIYIMMNVAYMAVLTFSEIESASAVAVLFGDRILGPFNFIIPLGVALSTFGCALSLQFGSARFCFAAGREGHMVECFSYIHINRLTPVPAVIIQGIISLIFTFMGDVESLIDFASFLVWIFYGLSMIALLIMRRTKKNVYRPYKVPIIIPILMIFISIFLSVVPIATDPSPKYLIAVGFILISVILYTPLIYYKKTPNRLMRKVTHIVQGLLKVIPPGEEDDDPPG